MSQYIVTIHDTGNITDDPRNIHTILTSRDFIAPRERVEVEPWFADAHPQSATVDTP